MDDEPNVPKSGYGGVYNTSDDDKKNPYRRAKSDDRNPYRNQRDAAGELGKGTAKHPKQKPLALMEYLIRTFTNEGGVVLDSFCGSGSTLVAARNTGRQYIGFELNRTHYTTAKMRLDDTPKAA